MSGLLISEDDYPEMTAVETIQRSLHAYNQELGGPYDREAVTVLARDDAGAVQGGLLGLTYWNWLFIDWLWLHRDQRGKGTGSALLARAEAIARKRGCTHAYTDTFSFHGPQFWVRNGWREAGRLDGMPPGHSRIWVPENPVRMAGRVGPGPDGVVLSRRRAARPRTAGWRWAG